MAEFVVQGRQRFPEGTMVGAFARLSDTFSRALDPVEEAQVKGGEARFTSLTADAPYWAAAEVGGQWRSVAFTPLNEHFSSRLSQVERRSSRETAEQVLRERRARAALHRDQVGVAVAPGSAAPGHHTATVVVTGARPAKVRTDRDPQPFPNQQDVQGVPQRSDTPFGEAHPKDPDEVVPRPSQDDVSGPQRSATEFGEGTPKDPAEVEPAISQEDATGKQRSDTELGSAEPKPARGSDVKRRESADAKARGETPAKPKRKTTPKK